MDKKQVHRATVGAKITSQIPVRKAPGVRLDPADNGGPGYLRPTLSSLNRGMSIGSVKCVIVETTNCRCGASKSDEKRVADPKTTQKRNTAKKGQQPSKIPLKTAIHKECTCAKAVKPKLEVPQVEEVESLTPAQDVMQIEGIMPEKAFINVEPNSFRSLAHAATKASSSTSTPESISFVARTANENLKPEFSKYRNIKLVTIPEYENPFTEDAENEEQTPFNSPGQESSRRATRSAQTPLGTLCEKFTNMEISTPLAIPFSNSEESSYYSTPCGKNTSKLESNLDDSGMYFTPPN